MRRVIAFMKSIFFETTVEVYIKSQIVSIEIYSLENKANYCNFVSRKESKMKIILYGKQGHAHTVAFKNFLKTSDVNFEYIDIMKDDEAKAHTKILYDGVLKFPTLFVEDQIYLTPTSEEFNNIMKGLKLRG